VPTTQLDAIVAQRSCSLGLAADHTLTLPLQYTTAHTTHNVTQGFLLILPIPMVVGVEQGIVNALTTTIGVLFRLSPFFFVFGTGTNAHYVNAAITQGTAKYQVSVPPQYCLNL
jgi:hypothetical protein